MKRLVLAGALVAALSVGSLGSLYGASPAYAVEGQRPPPPGCAQLLTLEPGQALERVPCFGIAAGMGYSPRNPEGN